MIITVLVFCYYILGLYLISLLISTFDDVTVDLLPIVMTTAVLWPLFALIFIAVANGDKVLLHQRKRSVKLHDIVLIKGKR